MIRTLAFVVVLLGSGLAWARGTVPIVNHEDVGIFTTSGKTPTLAEVRSAISAAAIANPKLKWSLSEDAPRGLIGTLLVRGKHTVRVSVRYTEQKFSVSYLDSINMNYRVDDGVPEIHPFCNRWVQELVSAISTNLSQL